MMKRNRSIAPANLKILLALPVIAILMIAFSSCKGKTSKPEASSEEIVPPPPPPPPTPLPYEIKNNDTIWISPDKAPVYPGGDDELTKFIAKNTTYPDAAKKNNIQGKVIVSFVVGTDGKVSGVNVVQGVNPDLDAEALRVVNSLPGFETPGMKDGKPVAVKYMVPIFYTLK